MYKKLKLFLWYLFCSIIITGCAEKNSYFIKPDIELNRIKKIAVLPFENLTSDEYAGEKIRRLVITELINKELEVIEPGEITRVLKETNIKSISIIKRSDLQSIGKELGADAILIGSVTAFNINRGITISYPEVTVNMRLIDSQNGDIIWSIHKTGGGADFWTRHFGSESPTLSEKAEQTVKEALKTIYKK